MYRTSVWTQYAASAFQIMGRCRLFSAPAFFFVCTSAGKHSKGKPKEMESNSLPSVWAPDWYFNAGTFPFSSGNWALSHNGFGFGSVVMTYNMHILANARETRSFQRIFDYYSSFPSVFRLSSAWTCDGNTFNFFTKYVFFCFILYCLYIWPLEYLTCKY